LRSASASLRRVPLRLRCTSTSEEVTELLIVVDRLSTAPDGTTTITLQHHLVTETGDTVTIDQAQAVGVFVAPGLFALTNYQIHLSGGTGRFQGATADMSVIGEADFNTGHLIGRYTGSLCTVVSGTP